MAVTGRIVVIFSRGMALKDIKPWQDDDGILYPIPAAYNIIIGGFDQALRILKIKALNLIIQEATGTEETYSMLKQFKIYGQ